ncbi:MAG: ferric reductase-like transmembrane domain-containing protein [Candidatus Thermoplasmatota archaeon]|nr:ferric reductase-like transmembrane domain-containing protein [Candidatus Thermoplasmatota archaeon]MDP7265280.1 ferric reductase-like transmembrane domain-containing protein [Candidatus Thermoplasmatota archaeon]
MGPTYLEPSSWNVLLNENGGEISLTAVEDITDLKIIAPSSLAVSPTENNSLSKGSSLTISLSPVENEKIDDNIIVTWKRKGTPYALTIDVIYNPKTEGETDYHSWVGRVTGISSIILLLLSMILGGMWNTKGILKRMIKSGTRIKFHCAISWFLFGLALYHGLTLLVSPYSKKLWNPWIVLGEIGALSMIVVSLTGSFKKFTIKLMGARKWRGFHLFATFVALVLGSIHGIHLGTDLAFIRDNAILNKFIIVLLAIGVVISFILFILKGKKNQEKAAAGGEPLDAKKATHYQHDFSGGGPRDDYNWNTKDSSDYYGDDYYDYPDLTNKRRRTDYYDDYNRNKNSPERDFENIRRNDSGDYMDERPEWPESETHSEHINKRGARNRPPRRSGR